MVLKDIMGWVSTILLYLGMISMGILYYVLMNKVYKKNGKMET